jgi:adenylate cyclase
VMLAPSPPAPSKGRLGKAALWAGVFALAAIYLFASRPIPLTDGQTAGRTIPIDKVFRILAAENGAARGLWTAEMVNEGGKVGLKFDEKWREKDVVAGPLPALFLRESATAIQKTKTPLGLFLGSDYPISQSNMFTGIQAEAFKKLRVAGEPQFFMAADIGRSTAMFADIVVAQGCATCHNQHPKSPKTDWKLKDIMGATTWSYPKDKVTVEEALEMVATLRASFGIAYDAYLAKVATFEKPPEIGEKWPRDGYFIPSKKVFLAEFEKRASANTADRLIHVLEEPAKTN